MLTLSASHNSSSRLSWPSCPRSSERRLPNRWLASRKRRASWTPRCPSGMTTETTSLCWLSRCAWSWWRWQTSPGECGQTSLAHTQGLFFSLLAADGPFLLIVDICPGLSRHPNEWFVLWLHICLHMSSHSPHINIPIVVQFKQNASRTKCMFNLSQIQSPCKPTFFSPTFARISILMHPV